MQPAVYLGSDRLMVEVSYLDMVLICDSSDRVAVSQLLRSGRLAPETSAYLVQNVGDEWTCVDIDAGPGYFTTLVGKLARNGRVHAFEPDSTNWELLLDNLAANGLDASVTSRRAKISSEAALQAGSAAEAEAIVPTLTIDLHRRHALDGVSIDLVRIGNRTLPSRVVLGAVQTTAANPLCRFLFHWDPAAIKSLGHEQWFEIGQLVRLGLRPSIIQSDGRAAPTDWRSVLDNPGAAIVASIA